MTFAYKDLLCMTKIRDYLPVNFLDEEKRFINEINIKLLKK